MNKRLKCPLIGFRSEVTRNEVSLLGRQRFIKAGQQKEKKQMSGQEEDSEALP